MSADARLKQLAREAAEKVCTSKSGHVYFPCDCKSKTPTIESALSTYGDERAREAVEARDMEWWEALALVDNVAPKPQAVKAWLLTLAAHEQEGVRREAVEAACRVADQYRRPYAVDVAQEIRRSLLGAEGGSK